MYERWLDNLFILACQKTCFNNKKENKVGRFVLFLNEKTYTKGHS